VDRMAGSFTVSTFIPANKVAPMTSFVMQAQSTRCPCCNTPNRINESSMPWFERHRSCATTTSDPACARINWWSGLGRYHNTPLMKDQLRNTVNQVLDGSFDPTGRTAPTATRMEGLLAALEFLPDGSLRTQVKETVNHGIAFLLRVQIRDGLYEGGMPGASIPKDPGTTNIRIDFVQHALCAWLRYQHQNQPRLPAITPLPN
jgi:hypothetical protein